MNDVTLLRRLDDLTTRVGRIERTLEMHLPPMRQDEDEADELPEELTADPLPTVSEAPPPAPDREPVIERPAPIPPPSPAVVLTPPRVPVEAVGGMLSDIADAVSIAPTPVLPYVAPRRAPSKPRRGGGEGETIERAIGLKVAGWVGAIVLVIGAALAIKFAYDNGVFRILPPAMRLVMMSLGGFALIGIGEWVYRRINTISAVGLFAAGVATLYLVSYAGENFYHLYGRDVAFVMMGLSTLIGAAVAMRGRLVSIAVLSIIGGNVAPLVLPHESAHLAPFLGYLLMLQVVALFLSWWGGREKWWVLRGVSLATTVVWTGAMLLTHLHANPYGPLLWFSLLYALLYHAELIASAFRHGVSPVPAQPDPSAMVSMIVTAFLTGAILFLFQDATRETRGLWVIALAAVHAITGFVLMRFDTKRLGALSLGHRLQAAALVVVAVPVALMGMWITIGWGVLALAFATLGRMKNLEVSRHAAVVTWLLAMGNLIRWSNGPSHVEAEMTWWTIFGTDVPAYAIITWIMAGVAHAIALLIESPSPTHRKNAAITHVLASSAWVAASMFALPPLGATFAIVVYAWILVAMERVTRREMFLTHALAMFALATVKWAVVDTLADRLSPGWSAASHWPVVNSMTALGAVIGVSLAAVYWLRREALPAWMRRGDDESGARLSLGVVLLGLATIALTFDVDRAVERAALSGPMLWPLWQAKHLAWTMLWTIATAGLAGVIVWLTPDPARRAARLRAPVKLAIALAIKFLIFDALLMWAGHGVRPALPIGNLQTITALVVFGALVGARMLEVYARPALGFLALSVLLIAGTLDVDRTFERLIVTGSTFFGDPCLAKQVALSIFWSLFATGAIVVGFRNGSAPLRYFALGLFAVTLAKVMAVDLEHAGRAYRIISFVGLGGLLLATSVLYGKLGPKLVAQQAR